MKYFSAVRAARASTVRYNKIEVNFKYCTQQLLLFMLITTSPVTLSIQSYQSELAVIAVSSELWCFGVLNIIQEPEPI